ncbi:MAG TPA: Crp/Fnr family transcriptional regulator [Nitrospiria bacterium]|nr:Crp/Fnr family transcriptional regulator [Nitrospiria bacterium]
MATKQPTLFQIDPFLNKFGARKTVLNYSKNQILFSQGDNADAVFNILKGKVSISVISPRGKEAIIATLDRGSFLGESCLNGQTTHTSTATAIEQSEIVRISKGAMIQALHDDPVFSEYFMVHLVSRNLRIEEDLVDQLFNSSEKRLARILLILANVGKDNKPEVILPKISQEALAEMIGTTRSRVSFFMHRFEKLGFIDKHDGLRVHSSLLKIVLHE